MRALVVIAVGSAAVLTGCGKPSAPADNAQPASSSDAAPPTLTDAQKKALLAELPAAYQTADLDNGQARFALCKSCHTAVEGGSDMTGPNLFGVFGRKAGSKPGFAYSDGLKASGITWDADHINTWIANPKAVVATTKMTYIGMSDPKDRTDLVAYLKVATSAPPKP